MISALISSGKIFLQTSCFTKTEQRTKCERGSYYLQRSTSKSLVCINTEDINKCSWLVKQTHSTEISKLFMQGNRDRPRN